MNAGRRRLSAALLAVSPSSLNLSLSRGTLSAPGRRGSTDEPKSSAPINGNVIQRKGRIFQVLRGVPGLIYSMDILQHLHLTFDFESAFESPTYAAWKRRRNIQVELRDVDSENIITERFRTDEAIERGFVQEKSYTYLYQEGDILGRPETFEQLEVPKDLFGKSIAYLKVDMTITLQTYDRKPMSATDPSRVTCTVTETQLTTKGQTATPQYKRVLLENGLTILTPSFIKSGDRVIINTTDDSYITGVKE